MRVKKTFTAGILICMAVIGIAQTSETPTFKEHEFRAHMEFLAHDLLEGRAMGTRGGELAAAYIAAQFKAAGLQPFSQEHGYFQRISLHGHTTDQDSVDASVKAGGETFDLKNIDDIVAVSEVQAEEINYSGDLLFVGYGIEAPEFGWDDYKGVDVTGKTLVMLVNDPDYEKTGFSGESLTYYGRYGYKQQIARLKGARGLILLHSDETATYGFQVVQTSWSNESFFFEGEPANPLELVCWITSPAINEILASQDLSFDKLKEKADSSEFQPFELTATIDISLKQNVRTISSPNVIGILPGSQRPDEYVIITGHYDHLGVGIPDAEGDTIYNGAMDNASGIAGIICLARAFGERTPPARTLVFFANTGEESGLMGSTYYMEHPPFPLENTIVAINKDVMSLYGRRDGFSAFPAQYSTAVADLEEIGERLGLNHRTVTVDRSGYAFRSDHFPFAARGVVAMSVGLSGKNLSLTDEEMKKIRQAVGRTYHQPSDEVHPLWRYDGVMQELELLYIVMNHWAGDAPKPEMTGENPFFSTMRLFKQLDAK